MKEIDPDLQRIFQQIILGVESLSITLLDVDGTILTWNKGVLTTHGYSSEEIIGQNISIFYLPEDRQTHLPFKLLQEASQNGSAKHIGRRIRKTGQIFWGSIEITSIHDSNGKVIGFTNLARELKDETDIGHFWFDNNGILHTKASPVAHTHEKIQEFRQLLSPTLSKGQVCCVADIRDAIIVDAEDVFNSPEIPRMYKAIAFVSNIPVDNNTVLAYESIKDIMPVKIFKSRDETTKWIKGYI